MLETLNQILDAAQGYAKRSGIETGSNPRFTATNTGWMRVDFDEAAFLVSPNGQVELAEGTLLLGQFMVDN